MDRHFMVQHLFRHKHHLQTAREPRVYPMAYRDLRHGPWCGLVEYTCVYCGNKERLVLEDVRIWYIMQARLYGYGNSDVAREVCRSARH